MKDMNLGLIIGRIVKDGDMQGSGETARLHFSLASHYEKKTNGQWEEQTQFFPFTLWGKRAESLQPYIRKGVRTAIQYELRQNSWEKDGEKRSRIETRIINIQLLDKADKKIEPLPEEDISDGQF